MNGYPLEGRPKEEVTYNKNCEQPFSFNTAKMFILPAKKTEDEAKKTDDDEEDVEVSPFQYSVGMVAEGHMFIGGDSQGMQVFKLAGKDTVVIARNFMDLQIRGNVFFQGDRMYARSMHYLYCIKKMP